MLWFRIVVEPQKDAMLKSVRVIEKLEHLWTRRFDAKLSMETELHKRRIAEAVRNASELRSKRNHAELEFLTERKVEIRVVLTL